MTKKIIVLSVILFCVSAGILALSRQAEADKSSPKLYQADLVCVKTAMEKRETAIQAAFDKFSSLIKTALQTRKNSLSAAWDISETKQRNAAIKTAWDNFRKAKQSATKTFRTEQLAAWRQFTKDRKACNVNPTGENQGDDISL